MVLLLWYDKNIYYCFFVYEWKQIDGMGFGTHKSSLKCALGHGQAMDYRRWHLYCDQRVASVEGQLNLIHHISCSKKKLADEKWTHQCSWLQCGSCGETAMKDQTICSSYTLKNLYSEYTNFKMFWLRTICGYCPYQTSPLTPQWACHPAATTGATILVSYHLVKSL